MVNTEHELMPRKDAYVHGEVVQEVSLHGNCKRACQGEKEATPSHL
jgi:hypothetical protein